jgi:hypothetical protein
MGLRKYKEAGCDGMDLKGDISMVDCATLRLVLELLPVPALALKCKFSIVSSKLMVSKLSMLMSLIFSSLLFFFCLFFSCVVCVLFS